MIRYILEEGWGYAGQTVTLGGFAQSAYKARETGEAFRLSLIHISSFRLFFEMHS